MKNIFLKFSSIFLLIAGMAMVSMGCQKEEGFTQRNMLQVDPNYGYTDINIQDCQYNLNNLPVEALSDQEKSSLLFMREEEKLARDIYLKLYDQWNHQVFNNISASEQTHTEAVLRLIEKYQLTDPVGNNEIGVFVNADLQALYDQLLQQGQTNLVEALKVGALVEEVDILDLENALNEFVDNQDMRLVYKNLMQASRNHLRAFVKNLQNQGVTYVPQRLSQEEFDAIVNSGWETGYHGGH